MQKVLAAQNSGTVSSDATDAAGSANASRAASWGKQSGRLGRADPLTPPEVRSGGGTQVPPGAIPVGMAALQTPDWVLARGETRRGAG
jgi:hypothetical protein